MPATWLSGIPAIVALTVTGFVVNVSTVAAELGVSSVADTGADTLFKFEMVMETAAALTERGVQSVSSMAKISNADNARLFWHFKLISSLLAYGYVGYSKHGYVITNV